MNDQNWPFTFPVGAFVRDRRDKNRWGQIAAPSKVEGRWIIQYVHGGRIEMATDQLETFQPASGDHARMAASTAQYHAAINEDLRRDPHLQRPPNIPH